MSKATMTITLEPELKTELQRYAKNLGTNASNLMSMLATQYIRKPRNPLENIEFEPFTDEEIKDLLKSPSIKKNIKKMEKLLAKI